MPHGYLSEDEGERSESEEGGGLPGTQVREDPSISSLLITTVWWYTMQTFIQALYKHCYVFSWGGD